MPKKRPAEFPTDWHWEAHLEALQRELAGRENRLAELAAMPDDAAGRAGTIAQTEMERDAVLAQLKRYGVGQAKASKRPAAAREKRA